MAWNTEKSMKEYLTTFSWVFWVLLFTFSAISTLFLLIKVIKNLSKVFMQQYNYPKLIWMKQTVSFACSNYRSNWQLIDNFCLQLSEPNRIQTRRKRIVNRIVTTEPRCTVISVNRFTSISNIIKMYLSLQWQGYPADRFCGAMYKLWTIVLLER